MPLGSVHRRAQLHLFPELLIPPINRFSCNFFFSILRNRNTLRSLEWLLYKNMGLVNWNDSFLRLFSNAKHLMRQAGLLRNLGEKDCPFTCSEMPNTVLPSGCSLSLFSGFGGRRLGFFCWVFAFIVLLLGFFLKVSPSQRDLKMQLVWPKGLPKNVFNRCGI